MLEARRSPRWLARPRLPAAVSSGAKVWNTTVLVGWDGRAVGQGLEQTRNPRLPVELSGVLALRAETR